MECFNICDGTIYTKTSTNFTLTYFSSSMPTYCNYGILYTACPSHRLMEKQ